MGDLQQFQAISNNGDAFPALWQSLTSTQQRFAIARLRTGTDKEAADEAGVLIDTVWHWRNKKDVDKAISAMIANARDSAMAVLEAGLIEAATVKLDGIRVKDAGKDRLAQEAASEIMDRLLGKPTQRIAPVMPNGVDAYQPDSPDAMDRTLARIAEMQRLAEERRARAERQATAVDTTAVITTLPIDTSTDKTALEQS